jgi:hypothetical protein
MFKCKEIEQKTGTDGKIKLFMISLPFHPNLMILVPIKRNSTFSAQKKERNLRNFSSFKSSRF